MRDSPHQSLLFPSLTPDSLSGFLNKGSGRPVDVTLTENRVTMISVSFPRVGPIPLRLHRAFLDAPRPVLTALDKYLRTRRKATWAVVRDFALSIRTERPPRRRRTLRPAGRVYDLASIAREVDQRFFEGRLRCDITWGPRRSPRRRRGRSRSRHFGSYRKEENLIVVHSRLDSRDVPRDFVEYIVYHEMLHAAIPSVKRNSRWVHHPRAFRQAERRFPDYPRMLALTKRFLD